MIDTPRISMVTSIALVAGLVVACACSSKRPPTRRAAAPNAELIQEERPETLSLAGVVRDEQGQPIPWAWIEVEGHPKPLTSPPVWRTDVHGRFRIDDLPPGPVKLLVSAGDLRAKMKVVETRTGVRDLVIVLDAGPQLLLRIVGYVPGEQTRWARVTWLEPDGGREVRYAPIRDDGWTRFAALPPDREIELWAEAEINRRYVRARGLKPGDTEHRIEIQEVRDIAGKVRASKARLESRIGGEAPGPLRERLRVDVYAQVPQSAPHFDFDTHARARLERDGSFRVRGLPPGKYLVRVGTHAGEIFSVSKFVDAGTTDAVISLDAGGGD